MFATPLTTILLKYPDAAKGCNWMCIPFHPAKRYFGICSLQYSHDAWALAMWTFVQYSHFF